MHHDHPHEIQSDRRLVAAVAANALLTLAQIIGGIMAGGGTFGRMTAGLFPPPLSQDLFGARAVIYGPTSPLDEMLQD